MLLSAGDFANYRSESNVFNLLVPRFRGMRSAQDRRELMETWLRSKPFRVSGLDAEKIKAKILADCRSGGDFLRLVMEEVACKQGVARWAECTPDHLLFIDQIKREIPDALIVHIIRDGRDVALSYMKQGWSHPLPWDRNERLAIAGLYWEWIVRKGRTGGKKLDADYLEVRFEDLIANPQPTLNRLGEFIGQDLDYKQIQQAGIGSVSEPNTSFSAESGAFNPVDRWKTKMSPQQLAELEALVGSLLGELGYQLASKTENRTSFHVTRLRATYLAMFSTKQWMKTHTPLGAHIHLGNLELN
jgi:hypothetical protein